MKHPLSRDTNSPIPTPAITEELLQELRAEIRKLKRAVRVARERTLADAIDALERESNGLHVRDAGLDDGIQRSIRVLWDMKRRDPNG